MPYVSGTGFKNKLLEAASLGMPIICSRRACAGLRQASLPLVVVTSWSDWIEQLGRLWSEPTTRESLGKSAREWVQLHHTWSAAARDALNGIGSDERAA